MVNGKVPLAQLLQQIADLVTSGEDSGSQASDGSVPVRLRSVVLALLDQVAANTSGKAAPAFICPFCVRPDSESTSFKAPATTNN